MWFFTGIIQLEVLRRRVKEQTSTGSDASLLLEEREAETSSLRRALKQAQARITDMQTEVAPMLWQL